MPRSALVTPARVCAPSCRAAGWRHRSHWRVGSRLTAAACSSGWRKTSPPTCPAPWLRCARAASTSIAPRSSPRRPAASAAKTVRPSMRTSAARAPTAPARPTDGRRPAAGTRGDGPGGRPRRCCPPQCQGREVAPRLHPTDPGHHGLRHRTAPGRSRGPGVRDPSKEADALINTGDERTKGQIMADLFVERLTGQSQQPTWGSPSTSSSPTRPSSVAATSPRCSRVSPAAPSRRRSPASSSPTPCARRPSTGSARLYTDPAGRLVALSTKQRFVTAGLADYLALRDQGLCRTPWCDAPARQADHITPPPTGARRPTTTPRASARRAIWRSKPPDGPNGWSANQAYAGVAIPSRRPPRPGTDIDLRHRRHPHQHDPGADANVGSPTSSTPGPSTSRSRATTPLPDGALRRLLDRPGAHGVDPGAQLVGVGDG